MIQIRSVAKIDDRTTTIFLGRIFMEHDKPGSDDPSSADFDAAEGGDEANARSVTDLIDRIERNAFKRYVSVREHRRQYAWSVEERFEH